MTRPRPAPRPARPSPPPLRAWRLLAPAALASLLLAACPVGAQDPGGTRVLPSPFPTTTPATPAAPGGWAPEERLVDLTLGLYQYVLDAAPDCAEIALNLDLYLERNEVAIALAVADLASHLSSLDERQRLALAASLRARLFDRLLVREGQRVLFDCVKARENQGRRRPVSKLMARFYALHEPLIEVLIDAQR